MLVIVRLTPSFPVSAEEVLITFPLLTCRFILIEELKVVAVVPLSKLVDEVPSLAREAVSVPSVTAMLAVTPLLVSIATDSPESVLKVDLLPELPAAFAVLPDPPLKDISMLVEPSGLSVLSTWVVTPLVESVVGG